MKFFKVFLMLTVILYVFVFCSPPPEMMKEEVAGNMHVKGSYSKDDVDYFLKFYKEMQEAVRTKNSEKAFSFYSKDFMSDAGVKLDELKKNTILLNKVYDKINYVISQVKIHIQGKLAVSTDNYSYSAVPLQKGYKSLNYKGSERIYWKKEKGTWKIVNWVYE